MQVSKAYDEMFMQYALALAKKGWGNTGINPLVGAVIVKDNRIVGQGFHRKLSEAHAEVAALVDAGLQAKGADLYVNLEPCCIHGYTPPCVNAIIAAQISRVVIGIIDPNPAVNGKGIRLLKNHNIEVITNVLEKQAAEMNHWYRKYITTKIPYTILKIAVSQDMKINGFKGKYITSEPSRRLVHSIRSQVSAVMVGINTVIADNPYLTDRLVGRHNPTRIVIDPHLKIPPDANFLDSNGRRIVITNFQNDQDKLKKLRDLGVEFIFLDDDHSLSTIIKKIGVLKIGSVMIEGGGKIFTQSLEEEIYDELYLFVAPVKVDHGTELHIDKKIYENIDPETIGEDLLYHVYRHN